MPPRMVSASEHIKASLSAGVYTNKHGGTHVYLVRVCFLFGQIQLVTLCGIKGMIPVCMLTFKANKPVYKPCMAFPARMDREPHKRGQGRLRAVRGLRTTIKVVITWMNETTIL